jgi:hypothetical protein
LIFSTTFAENFLILRRTERDMIKNVHRSSYKITLLYIGLHVKYRYCISVFM